MFITKRRLREIQKESYELGLLVASEFYRRMMEVERSNRGFIIGGTKLDQELEDIIARKRKGL